MAKVHFFDEFDILNAPISTVRALVAEPLVLVITTVSNIVRYLMDFTFETLNCAPTTDFELSGERKHTGL
jgi:hypothetical protein